MKTPISVIIICHNEAHIIARTIMAAKRITADVVVVDSGSTDGTQSIVSAGGARLLETTWEGYGSNKNKGVALALHNWVLSIDADEVVDDTLVTELQNIVLTDTAAVYTIPFRVFFGDKMIRYGEWANESHIRLYNRLHTGWNEAKVHERLQLPDTTRVKSLKGHIHHHTSRDIRDLAQKTVSYAMLNAVKYHRQGKHSGWFTSRMAPAFSFILNYFFRLGFLDGKAGFTIAKMNAWYTWLKYARLRELNNSRPDTK